MPAIAASSMWKRVLPLAMVLAAASAARAQQPEVPTPGQAPQPVPGTFQGQAQPPPEEEQPPAEEPVQTIAPQPVPQLLFGQPGYGLGGFGALQQYLDADLGVAYTDNALLTANDRLSTVLGTVGFDTNYAYSGSNIAVVAIGNIDWLQYLDHAFPGTVYGRFDGTAMWGHSSDLLQWVARETYLEGQADPIAAATPVNLQEINYFTTGPYLNLNFATADRLTFYGLYSNTAFESSPFNSQTFDGGTTLTHGLSAASSVSLQLDSAYYSFDNTNVASDYNFRTVRVMYDSVLARTRVSVSAGYSFEDYGGPYSGSPMATLQLTHQISSSQSVSLSGNYGYTTFGTATRADLTAPLATTMLIGAVPVLATAAPYKDHLVSAGWTFARARTTFSLVGSYDREVYVAQSVFDNRTENITASLTRSLRPTLSLALRGYRSWFHYGGLDNAQVTLTSVNLSLVKQFRKLGVSVYAQRTQQSYGGAVNPLGYATGAYTEDRVGLQVTYDLLGARSPAALLPGQL